MTASHQSAVHVPISRLQHVTARVENISDTRSARFVQRRLSIDTEIGNLDAMSPIIECLTITGESVHIHCRLPIEAEESPLDFVPAPVIDVGDPGNAIVPAHQFSKGSQIRHFYAITMVIEGSP